LLHAGDVFGDVLHRHGILDRKAMALCFQSCFVDENPRIGVEASEGETDVCVDEGDLGGGDAGVLQLHCRPLFAAQHDDVCAFDADGAGAAFDRFEGVFDLEDVSVGGED
jgi:hypothetical protein